MQFDTLLNHIGQFGTFQKLVILWIYLGGSLDGYHYGISVFILPEHKHRCAIPGMKDDTYEIQGPEHLELINNTIPHYIENDKLHYDRCHIYNGTSNGNESLVSCNSWVFDKSVFTTSVVQQMELVCEDSMLTSHSVLLFFTGVLIGVVSLGNLSDLIGRRIVMAYSICLQGVAGVASAWSTNYYVFCFLRFLTGVGCSGSYIPTFILATEMVGLKYRTAVGIVEQAFFSMGFCVLCGLAYIIKDWRILMTIVSIPSFIFSASYFLIIPESPRWLISAGRDEEADIILKRMARINKKALPREYFDEKIGGVDRKKTKCWKICLSPALLVRTFIMSFNWIAVSIVYFGLALNSGDLGGSVFVNFFVGALVEFPAYTLCIFLLDRMGRKKLHATVMTIGGLSCLATIVPILMSNSETAYRWVILILAMIGKLGITSAFGVVYLYSCELFPTVLRNSAMGMFSTCGRIGAVLAPYIADLGDFIGGKEGRALPMVLFGVTAIVAGGLAQVLPETKGRKLPDTIKDAEKMSRKKQKPQELRLMPSQS